MPSRQRVFSTGGRNLGGPPNGKQGDVYVDRSTGALAVHDGAKFSDPKVAGLQAVQGSASGTAGAATVNAMAGTVTSEALTTAAGADYTLTLTNSKVTAGSVVLVALDNGTNTTAPIYPRLVTPGAGSVVIVVRNAHASAALNGTIKVRFLVVN